MSYYSKYSTLSDCEVKTPAGVLRILFSSTLDDTALPPSNIPKAVDYLIGVDEVIESIDGILSVLSPNETTINLIDDYEVYPEGVFYKMITGGDTRVLVALSEDEGVSWGCLFVGTVFRNNVQFEERYIGTVLRRTISVSISTAFSEFEGDSISVLADLTSRNASYFNIESKTDPIVSAKIASLADIFRSCMYAAFGSETDYANSIVIPSGRNDIDYLSTSTNYIGIASVYFFLSWKKNYYPAPTIDYFTSPYFDNAQGTYWGVMYPTIRKLMGHFARLLGYGFRVVYGNSSGVIDFDTMTNNKFYLVLINRGKQNDGSGFVSFESNEKQSALALYSSMKATEFTLSVRVETDQNDDDSISDGLYQLWSEFSHPIINTNHDPISPFDYYHALWWKNGSSPYNLHEIGAKYYYDYFANTRVNATVICAHPAALFYRKRFSKSSVSYERTYRGIAALISGTTSTNNIFPGVRTQVSDGATTRTFYANEVRKNVMTNEMTIQWIEE